MGTPRSESSGRRPLLALLCLTAAAWSLLGFAKDSRARRPVESFAKEFALVGRRPLEIAAMRLEPSADGAAAVLADLAVEDALGTRQVDQLDPDTRQLWIESAARLDAELTGAQGLMVEALARRPGWAQHRFLLGQVVYAAQGRRPDRAAGEASKWLVPLRLAAAAAPGLEPVWTFLGGAYLERWASLEPETRADAPATLSAAFRDPGFVLRGFRLASSVLGREESVRLLPDQSRSLRAAAKALALEGDIPGVAELLPRLARVSRKERESGVRAILDIRKLRDPDRAHSACLVWVRDFPPRDYDDSVGRAQSARVLKAWPDEIAGSWRSDPRADLIRFFLNRRERNVPGAVLLQAASALTEVPEIVRAHVHLLAGDEPAALEIARQSPAEGSLEWSAFYVVLARERLARGDAVGAREALALVSPMAREDCDSLVLRRDVDVGLGDTEGARAAGVRLRLLEREEYPAESWSAEGITSFCLTPDSASGRKLRLAVSTSGPTVLRYGWNGGWQGSAFVAGRAATVLLPLPPGSGRHTLAIETEYGPPVRLGTATLVPVG